MNNSSISNRAATALLATLLTACGGGGGNAPAAPAMPTAPVPPTITLAAAASQMAAGGRPVALTAAVSSSATVTWSLSAGAPGSLSASSGASVNYLPPASGVTAPVAVTVTASAGGGSQTLQLTVYPDPGPAGLSLIAGVATGSAIDGMGAAARFDSISTIAADAAGNSYIVDQYPMAGGRVIRKITPAGVVTTLGGAGTGQFNGVSALAAAPDGTLYLFDQYNEVRRVRTLAADGTVQTLFNGSAIPGSVSQLAAGGDGSVYLMTLTSIIRLNADGGSVVLAGTGGATDLPPADGKGSAANFTALRSIALTTGGDLYATDNGVVRKITADGTVSTPWPQGSTQATRHDYVNLVVEPAGTLLASESINGDPTNLVVSRIALDGTSSQIAPLSSLADGTDATRPPLLAESGTGTLLLAGLRSISQLTGKVITPLAGVEARSAMDVDGSGASAHFDAPAYLAYDMGGNVYVADNMYAPPNYEAHGLVLRKITSSGVVSTLVAQHDFGVVTAIVADRKGNIFISSSIPRFALTTPSGGGAISKVAPDGTVSTLKSSDHNGTLDGTATPLNFFRPVLLGVDGDGNLYLQDSWPCCSSLSKMTPDGTLSAVSSLPAGVGAGVAPDGASYTVDSNNDVVYRVAVDGSKTVVAGVSGANGTVLGALPGSLFNPAAIVPTGLYSFAVVSGNAILKLVLPH